MRVPRPRTETAGEHKNASGALRWATHMADASEGVRLISAGWVRWVAAPCARRAHVRLGTRFFMSATGAGSHEARGRSYRVSAVAPAHGVQLACAHPRAGPESAHSAPSPLDGGRAGLDDSRARRMSCLRRHAFCARPPRRSLGDLRLASRRFAPCPQRVTCETASCGCQQGKGRGRMRRICISGPVLARVTGSLTLCELFECLMLATLHVSSAAPL